MTDSRESFVLRGVRRIAFHFADTARMGLALVYVYDEVMVGSRVSFVPGGMERSVFHLAETAQIGWVPVHVYDVYDACDGVSWVPFKDIFEKSGYVLPSALPSWKRRKRWPQSEGQTFLFLGVMRQVGAFQGAECATSLWRILV